MTRPKLKSSKEVLNPRFKELVEDDVILENVPDYIPPRRAPALADKAVYDKVVEKVRQGNYITTVAASVGVEPETIMRWLEKGKRGENTLYHSFYLDVQEAWAEAEINVLGELRAHGRNDWRALAWMLERTRPEKFALRTISRSEVSVSGEIAHKIKEEIAGNVLEDETKRDLVRQLITNQKID